jgi:hypothetical protein
MRGGRLAAAARTGLRLGVVRECCARLQPAGRHVRALLSFDTAPQLPDWHALRCRRRARHNRAGITRVSGAAAAKRGCALSMPAALVKPADALLDIPLPWPAIRNWQYEPGSITWVRRWSSVYGIVRRPAGLDGPHAV